MGFTGTNLFFVLSGFILAYNYPVVADNGRFYAYRFARIYPLYALSLLVGLPKFIMATWRLDHISVLVGIPFTFALLQGWWPPFRNLINSAAWTLPVEAFFYLCFPFLMPWVTRKVGHWKLWTSILAVLLLTPTLISFFIIMPLFPAVRELLRHLLNIPLFHLGEFVIGMIFGLRFLQKRPTFNGLQVFGAFVLVVGGSAAALLIPWTHIEIVVDGLLAVPLVILLYTLAGWPSRVFGHPLFQFGGEISYGIYLLQFPVSSILIKLYQNHGQPPEWLLPIVLVTAASLCYILVEKPSRRRILHALGYAPSPKPIPTPGLDI